MKRLTTIAAVAAAIAVPAAALAAPASAAPTASDQPDLAITLEAPAVLNPGQPYIAYVSVKNLSTLVPAKKAKLHIALPAALVEDIKVEGDWSHQKPTVPGVYEIGDIGANDFQRILQITAKVRPAPGASFIGAFEVSSMEGDAKPSDNYATATTRVNTPTVPPVVKKADLKSSAKAGKVRRGKTARFYGTVVNNGPNAANKVVVLARLSKNLKITRVTGVKYKLRKDGRIELNLAGLPKGKKVSFTVVAKAAKKARKVSFSVRANSAVKDPNGANNYALTGVKVTK